MSRYNPFRVFIMMLCCVLACCAIAEAAVTELPVDASGGMPLNVKYQTGMTEYSDPSISVRHERVESKEWTCTYYVARIQIAHASQLRTESARGWNSRGRVRGSAIAKRVNAVVACDGDYFSGRSGSYILRQGVEYKAAMDPGQDLLLIDEDGDFHIVLAEEEPEKLDKTMFGGKKIVNALCFGPALVKGGQKVLNLEHEQRNTHGLKRAQRMCICQTGPLEYMIVCCAHYGMNLSDFTDLVLSLGNVQQAYNLDGGDSSSLLFLGTKINNTQAGEPRELADIVYFASAWTPDEV